jgi:hypothetical protein
MGQYYRAFNLTKKLSVSSHDVKEEGEDYGSGSKLMEHSYVENNFVGAIMELLKKEWKGDKIAWIGDYYETGEIEGIPSWEEALDSEDSGYQSFTPPPATVKRGFLNNHTLGISIDLSNCSVYENMEDPERGWELNPLSILTACGNGRGGGDYRGDFPFIGAWAGHEFSVTDAAVGTVVPFNFDMEPPNSQKFIQEEEGYTAMDAMNRVDEQTEE